ncbi:MAG: dTMP kinase [Desulfonatronovibrionaceae bacterium]
MFITFEGIEGCGKSTQTALLAEHLKNKGAEVILTREPGGSRLGRKLRSILLSMENFDICSETELFLYLADRSQHVHTVINPGLEAGSTVISDRFADSMIVYQGYGRGLDIEMLSRFNNTAVKGLSPDLTILLDLPAEAGLQRALNRNIQHRQTRKEGRFEAEDLDFHSRIREGYLEWASQNKHRFFIVDALQGVEDIAGTISSKIQNFFEKS